MHLTFREALQETLKRGGTRALHKHSLPSQKLFYASVADPAPVPPMLSPHVSLAIPICAAVYLLAVYLVLMLAQRNRLSRLR